MKYIALLVCSFSLFLSGCNDNYIEKVIFEPSADLETINLQLIFTDAVTIKFEKKFKIKDFGYVYLNKYSSTQPFEIGLNLKTAIVNEQDYVHIEPTDRLPNGTLIPVPHKLVEVRAGEPITSDFDMLAYVDVIHKSWVGLAAMFKPTDQNFPEDLMLSQVFLRDSQGLPAVIATLFGPHKQADGTMLHAGVSIFANFRALTQQGVINASQRVELEATEDPYYMPIE